MYVYIDKYKMTIISTQLYSYNDSYFDTKGYNLMISFACYHQILLTGIQTHFDVCWAKWCS